VTEDQNCDAPAVDCPIVLVGGRDRQMVAVYVVCLGLWAYVVAVEIPQLAASLRGAPGLLGFLLLVLLAVVWVPVGRKALWDVTRTDRVLVQDDVLVVDRLIFGMWRLAQERLPASDVSSIAYRRGPTRLPSNFLFPSILHGAIAVQCGERTVWLGGNLDGERRRGERLAAELREWHEARQEPPAACPTSAST
jgi:hypothetical protein